MISAETFRPRLRQVDPQPIQYEGMDYLYLRDPLNISGRTLLVPQPLIPVLAFCDGTRTLKSLQSILSLRRGLKISLERLEEMIAALDEACLLESDTYQTARAAAQQAYRSAPQRASTLAGLSYPDDPQELNALFSSYLTKAGVALDGSRRPLFRGLLSPHIDYDRGWQTYAQTWAAAHRTVCEADLAIIIGTDHYSEAFPLTLTRQPYATPFGPLPIPENLVTRLALLLGEEQAFGGELHHRSEHSIELAAVWLHFLRQDQPIEMLPILTGHFDRLAGPDGSLESSLVLRSIVQIINQAMQHRRVLIVAAGDLAHVGPAFGGAVYGADELQLLRNDDQRLLACLEQGSAEPFHAEIQTGSADNNVCGASPIYLMLRILGSASGQTFGYNACPADQQGTSFVTIAGAGLV